MSTRAHLTQAQYLVLSISSFEFLPTLLIENKTFSGVQALHEKVEEAHHKHPTLPTINRIVHHKGPLLSKYSSLKSLSLQEFHSTTVRGNAASTKTLNRLQENVYWSGMWKEVEDFVTSCPTCQPTKYLPRAPFRLSQPYLHLLQFRRTYQWILSQNYLCTKNIPL